MCVWAHKKRLSSVCAIAKFLSNNKRFSYWQWCSLSNNLYCINILTWSRFKLPLQLETHFPLSSFFSVCLHQIHIGYLVYLWWRHQWKLTLQRNSNDFGINAKLILVHHIKIFPHSPQKRNSRWMQKNHNYLRELWRKLAYPSNGCYALEPYTKVAGKFCHTWS